MNEFMIEAIKEAYKGINNKHGGPFGAVVVKDNKIVGRGHNTVLTSHDPTAHGEVNAIRDATKNLNTHDLTGCVIYTTGYPCPMCLGAILWANIETIYYGCNVIDTEIIGFRDNDFYKKYEAEEKEYIKEMDRNECLKLYEDYKNTQHELY